MLWSSKILVAVVLGLPLLLSAKLRAEDWPQWRGPNRDGVCREAGLLQSFPAEGMRVRWRVPVGWGFASPVVAQGRVFLADSDLSDYPGKERLHCWDETTGSRVAVLEPTMPFSGRKVAWPPPAYANRHIFARSGKELICASLAAKP